MRKVLVLTLSAAAGCGATIEPGHRGLLFNPRHGGLQKDVLGPGYHPTGYWGRLDDFDVTYQTRKEEARTKSLEGAIVDVKLSIIFRPIVQELYELDTEIGTTPYDEVVGPEFRTAIRGVFARHSYLEVQKMNEKIEDEIEAEVRRRIQGKHMEISSVTLESIEFPPEIDASMQAKLLGEQEQIRKATLQQAEHERMMRDEQNKLEEQQREQTRLADKAEAARRAELLAKQHEREVAEEEAKLARVRDEAEAQAKIVKAKAEAQAISLLADAKAKEKRVEAIAVTPLTVMMHGYDALAKLGGENTSFIFGDWSKVPSFLFPQTPAFRALFPGALEHAAAPHGGGSGASR